MWIINFFGSDSEFWKSQIKYILCYICILHWQERDNLKSQTKLPCCTVTVRNTWANGHQSLPVLSCESCKWLLISNTCGCCLDVTMWHQSCSRSSEVYDFQNWLLSLRLPRNGSEAVIKICLEHCAPPPPKFIGWQLLVVDDGEW